MAGAQGAVDSLLGRLTSVLLDEAQLLGGLRGDVEFIRDEMETMNGLLRHLTESQHRNHLVRAWMKQIVGLARDCEGNVELYLHRVGGPADDARAGNCLLRYLRRLLRLLQSVPARHRIATRIRELKERARDVGDRRKRYGITVPYSTDVYDGEAAAGEDEDTRRRQVLLYGTEPPASWFRKQAGDEEVMNSRSHAVVQWLVNCARYDEWQSAVKVFSIIGNSAEKVAERVYGHPSLATLFSIKRTFVRLLEEIPEVLKSCTALQISEIRQHLRGERFLVLFTTYEVEEARSRAENMTWPYSNLRFLKCNELLDALSNHSDRSYRPGSSIIMATQHHDLALSSPPYKIIDTSSPPNVYDFYDNQVKKLGAECSCHVIFTPCHTDDTFAMKTFLHLLYVNPNRTPDELKHYTNAISKCRRLKRSIPKQVLLWCYNELPSKYRSCLLYLTVFPEGYVIRTTSLARRWVAEGLITVNSSNTSSTATEEIQSSTDEAEHCLDVLFIRGFVSLLEICAEGNIKSCTVHREVREFIARVATDVNFRDSTLPPHLARYLSIHNRLGLQISHSDGESKDIAGYLPSLAASPQWQLLKVLDLEGCKGLGKKKNLKSICKILLLKYLSLRNTDVAELPMQMKELQCLETLDIRQTKVRVFNKKAIVLPLLKHFLAGDKISVSNGDSKSEGSFSAVDMPLGIHRMNNLEILSHVQVTNSNSELTGIAELLRLRKLGVDLRGKKAKLSDLFRQIEQLHIRLRYLSVRFDQAAASENHGDLTPPKFIQSLNISGLTNGLPQMIQQLHCLAKLTLTEAYLKEDGLCILGRLPGLRCLRLLHQSYIQSELSFKEEEFQALNFLLVGTSDVSSITFSIGAAPKLERIIWTLFHKTAHVSGLSHLPELWEFVLNGGCNPDEVIEQIELHRNLPVFKHNPNVQKQEDIAAASGSSSSAP